MVIERELRTPTVSDVPAAPRIRTRRNPKWVALGIVAICLGAIASFFLYSQVAESHQVAVVRRSLQRGATIRSGDLGSVTVGNTSGIDTVPATAIPDLVGRVAATDLFEGSLVPPSAVTTDLPPAHGKDIIGLRLATGRAPSGFLVPGSPVRLVVLPVDAAKAGGSGIQASDAGASSRPDAPAGRNEVTNVATISAAVISTVTLDDGVLINVELDAGQAVDAASYAAQDRVVVIRESER